MKSRWRQLQPFDMERDYVVFASSIPARHWSSTGRLFRGSRSVAAQLEATGGVVGFAMLARPLRKQYATVSVWVDDAALRDFASSPPHAQLMAHLAPEMAPTTFRRWTIKGSHGRPSWNEALARLSRAER